MFSKSKVGLRQEMADTFPPPLFVCMCVCFTGRQMPSTEDSKASTIDLKGNLNMKQKQLTEKLLCTAGLLVSCSVQFSHSVVSNSLRPHELQHARPPCPSPILRVYSNSCPSSQWCHPTISSSIVPFSSCLQSFPASGSFPMSQLFASGGQSIGVSASTSVPPMNIQDWFRLGWTG